MSDINFLVAIRSRPASSFPPRNDVVVNVGRHAHGRPEVVSTYLVMRRKALLGLKKTPLEFEVQDAAYDETVRRFRRIFPRLEKLHVILLGLIVFVLIFNAPHW